MLCLEGIVVLDLARRYPGAYTAMFLADFGAEVIKIDPPGSTLPVSRESLTEERYAAYNPMDRNKRSMLLNLKSDGGKQVFYRLAQRADVVIEGFRPGVMDRLGVGYSRLSEINPGLIYCGLSGFGQDGPYVNVPAHDMNYIGIGGVLSLIGERDGKPYLPSNIVADVAGAGMHGLVGILLALVARSRSGKGQFVDVTYLDSTISLLAYTSLDWFEAGIVPKRGETNLTGAAPWAQVFRCKDGEYVTVGAAEQHLWENFCRVLGREDLIPDREASRERADQIIAELAVIFQTRTRDEWVEVFKDKQACFGPVNNLNETFQDPQVLHRKMVVEVEHPTFGVVRQQGIPVKLSDTPGRIRSLGVPTGSDTDVILGELGYSATEIATLRSSGTFG